ncbi:DUF4190 domain-containing protein [Calycomorphotria hydatis]|uniref:DUF4190 domain-containing protein n=1 Tax=Calycomorphotria hydatis TaxID=2528027 RepID=A0A517TAE2_9PLAN|nr:DUF4190 domain-containing protein [Calycomorphotria hydatis]QDT65338.1 hypothetical protein V22_25870 [Calycomorphotria hydatis]
MSQSIASAEIIGASQPRDTFEYRPVPLTAPVSLILGICSTMSLLTLFGIPVALIGLVLGVLAMLKIGRSQGEYGGMTLARLGSLVSGVFLVVGISSQTYAYVTEVPEGHTRLNFTMDISDKGFVVEDGIANIHPDIEVLDGQKVFLKGFMYPTQQISGIKSFIFCKDNGQCCFGGQPAMTDMILVELQDGLTANFREGKVAVAGTFKLRPEGGGELSPVYELQATHFGPARSAL